MGARGSGDSRSCADCHEQKLTPCLRSQSRSEVEAIANAIWLSRFSKDNIMGLLSAAYFDASGKQHGYSFMTVAGAASSVKKWDRFEIEWNKTLADEGVTEFHATDFAASQGEFKNWKDDKARRSAFMKRLIAIVKKSANKLFILTIEIPVWNQVNREFLLKENLYCAYALAGFSVAGQVLQWANKRKVAKPFNIFFEEGDEGWGGLTELCKQHLQFEPIRIPKKKGIPFQIGDLLAWKTRITAQNLSKMNLMDDVLEGLNLLNKILVVPHHNGIYTIGGLRNTCKIMGIPKREKHIL